MRTMCGCTKNNNLQNPQGVILRRRCVCWYEPIRQVKRRCCNNELEGMSLQLINSCETIIPAGDQIIFDEIAFKNCDGMCCHKQNGTIEINRCGTYQIDWDIAVECCKKSGFARFGVEVNGEIVANAILPTTSGQLSGCALIQVDHLPAKVRLINDTGESVKLSGFSPAVNLRITTSS